MPIIKVDNLTINYNNTEQAVSGLSFSVEPGETLGIIGESGCGKTTMLKSLFRLLPPNAKVLSGSVTYNGQNVFLMSKRELRRLRGREIGCIPQDVAGSFNDIRRIRSHFYDVMGTRNDSEILELLERVRLSDAKRVMNSYPFELSGGMKQRVLMALALSLKPKLLIADEPTSSIDAPLRREIMRELLKIRDEEKMTLILITHNIRELRNTSDRVIVMYRGRIIEEGPTQELFDSPKQEYTRSLLRRAFGEASDCE